MGAHTKFEEVFNLLKEYKEEHGHCNVPSDYKVGTINLGDIVGNIRGGKRNTTSDQKAMLDSIGFIWNVKKCTSFEEFFRLLEEYKEEHGHCNVPSDYKVGTINLGDIVSNIRGGKRKTTNDQKAMLDSIDFVWKIRDHNSHTSFDEVVNLLEKYKEQNGHCDVPQ